MLVAWWYRVVRVSLMVLMGCMSFLWPASAQTQAIEAIPGNEVFYYITVDRFFDGNETNNIPNYAFPATTAYNQANQSLIQYAYDPSHRYVGMYWGGDLEGIIQKLDYLADLGITKIILSPIQDNANVILYSPQSNYYIRSTVHADEAEFNSFYAGISTPFHGNWTQDWFEIDEHFRHETPDRLQVFRELLNAAGQRGIGILLELNLNHTSPYRESTVFDDFNLATSEQWSIDNGSIYRHGVRVATYLDPVTGAFNPEGWFHQPISINYQHPTPIMLEQGAIEGLPDIDQSKPPVLQYLHDGVEFWLNFNSDGTQVAGFYLDNVQYIQLSFWQQLEQWVQSINPSAILIANHLNGGLKNQAAVKWYHETQAYTLVDDELSQAARNYFRQERGWDGRVYVLKERLLGHQGQYYTDPLPLHWLHRSLNPSQSLEIPRSHLDQVTPAGLQSWLTFVEHPDQPRLLSAHPEVSELAYASLIKFMMVSAGIPMIDYGTETGLAIPHHIDHQGTYGVGGHPFNKPMMIWPEDQGWNADLFHLMHQLIYLRRDQPVLRYGNTRFLSPSQANAVTDLFMLRESPNYPDQVLYAYSTTGGDFILSLEDQHLKPAQQIIDIETGYVYPSQSEFKIQLAAEASKVILLKS